jgi:hypothetical protein
VVADKRNLLAVLVWVLYTCPTSELRQWTKTLEPKTLAGYMFIITDIQGAFRYNYGKDKYLPEQPRLPADLEGSVTEWDARYSTLVTMLGCRLISYLLVDVVEVLATVKLDKSHPAVFPFFLLVESVIHFGNSTAGERHGRSLLRRRWRPIR